MTARVETGGHDPKVSHEDMVILTSWMADSGCSASEVARAVEKPWNYLEELGWAKAALSEPGY